MSGKMNKTLKIEAGKTIEEVREDLERWLSAQRNFDQISLEQVSRNVLPDLKLFQQKRVRFIFDKGTQEPRIEDNEVIFSW